MFRRGPLFPSRGSSSSLIESLSPATPRSPLRARLLTAGLACFAFLALLLTLHRAGPATRAPHSDRKSWNAIVAARPKRRIHDQDEAEQQRANLHTQQLEPAASLPHRAAASDAHSALTLGGSALAETLSVLKSLDPRPESTHGSPAIAGPPQATAHTAPRRVFDQPPYLVAHYDAVHAPSAQGSAAPELENAAIVVLARNRERYDLQNTLRSFEATFNHERHYPYVFLNDDVFDNSFIEIQRRVAPRSEMWFGKVRLP